MIKQLFATAFALTLAATLGLQSASAQTNPSNYTSATRYDQMGSVVGTIAPDPDGGGALKYLATRTTYDDAGRPILVETGELSVWKSEAILPANWGADFTVLSSAETTYDEMGRKATESAKGSDGIAVSLTQYSYDNVGRLECTAVRMNPAAYNSLPASACTLGMEGNHGPDRITKNTYTAYGQLLQTREAVGTSIESSEVTYTYTGNGKIKQVIDANGNRAELRYDDHDRQSRWVFPSKTGPSNFDDTDHASAVASAGALNENDYEEYTYDDNGNRLKFRKRDGTEITYQYDALNRMTVKVVPQRPGLSSIHTRDIYYSYDLRGLQLAAKFGSLSGYGNTATYDGFGRLLSERQQHSTGGDETVSYQYDKNGNKTLLTHGDGVAFKYSYDGLNRRKDLRLNSDNSLFSRILFNNRGLMYRSTNYGTLAHQEYQFDPVGRMSQQRILGAGSATNVIWDFTRNPASQILSESRDNDAYAWTDQVNVVRDYITNGLNQYEAAGAASFCYDANGNLTADGSYVYLYDIENRLVQTRLQGSGNNDCNDLAYTGTNIVRLYYDPAGRLYRVNAPGSIVDLFYDGDALIEEHDSSGVMLRRYVHGVNPGADDPLMWFEGSTVTTSSARYLYADPRGSIVLVRDGADIVNQINSYDEYGIPGSNNLGRFQYTGQLWLSEIGMYYYKARIYSPTLGRFLQTDPIGYEDQFNLYAYVGNDPINLVDPTGRQSTTRPRRPGIPMPGRPVDTNGNGRDDAADIAIQIEKGAKYLVKKGAEFVDWLFNEEADIDPGAAGEVPDLTGQTEDEAAGEIEKAGFKDKGTNKGGYRKFTHADGSVIWIDGNGRVVRTGPKIQNPDPNKKGYRPRIDQNGKPTDSHDTGENVEVDRE